MKKRAYECAKYIVTNDIGARKQTAVIMEYCPKNVALDDFLPIVSDYTFELVQEAMMEG